MQNRSRIALLATTCACLVLVACESGQQVAAPYEAEIGAASPRPASLLGFSLLSCTPTTADSATVSIGAEGGTIDVGPHQLTVPPGALDSTVSITMVTPSDTVNRVTLLPEGLTFASPASLRLSYANCGGLGGLPLHRIAYIDGSFSILDILPSIDNLLNERVTTSLHHFSDYAVAW